MTKRASAAWTVWLRPWLCCGVGATAIAVATPAAAQVRDKSGAPDCVVNPQDPGFAGVSAAEQAPGPGTFVVTGSRIARRDYEANSPIVSFDEEFLRQSSTAAMEEQLNRLPQFVVAQPSITLNGISGTGGRGKAIRT